MTAAEVIALLGPDEAHLRRLATVLDAAAAADDDELAFLAVEHSRLADKVHAARAYAETHSFEYGDDDDGGEAA